MWGADRVVVIIVREEVVVTEQRVLVCSLRDMNRGCRRQLGSVVQICTAKPHQSIYGASSSASERTDHVCRDIDDCSDGRVWRPLVRDVNREVVQLVDVIVDPNTSVHSNLTRVVIQL